MAFYSTFVVDASSSAEFELKSETLNFNARVRDPYICNIIVCKNTANSTELSSYNTNINSISSAFNGTFGVSFNVVSNYTSDSLNQKTGCERQAAQTCNEDCGDVTSCRNTHHKSAPYFVNIFTSNTYRVVRFVDYKICNYKNSDHHPVNGLTDYVGGNNIIITNRSPNLMRTTCHELSHFVGAVDNVCSSSVCTMSNGDYYNVWCTNCASYIENYLNQNT